ncbi:MAG: dodecin family protein [Bacteroidota bacterium]|nr:dodecin family protein [Bacteroidota bacterium]
MSVIKVIEVIATSENSFEEAVKNAVTEAGRTVKNIKSVYVKDMNGKVQDNKIVSYGVTAKISFLVKD